MKVFQCFKEKCSIKFNLFLIDNFFEVSGEDGNDKFCEDESEEENHEDEVKQGSPVDEQIVGSLKS